MTADYTSAGYETPCRMDMNGQSDDSVYDEATGEWRPASEIAAEKASVRGGRHPESLSPGEREGAVPAKAGMRG